MADNLSGRQRTKRWPFINAFVAVLEGLHKRERFARTARGVLLENELSIDPVGYELNMNFMCVPSHSARTNLGNYKARSFMFGSYSNTMRIRPGHGLDLGYLDRYFEACLKAEQPPDKTHNRLDGFYPNPLVCNERHPGLAELAFKKCWEGDWNPIRGKASCIPYYLVWVNPAAR